MKKEGELLSKMLQSYLKMQNYSIEYNDLKLQLLSNSSFPNVKSFTDTLDYFEIENIVAKVPKSTLEQLPETFLTIINEGAGALLALVSKRENHIVLRQGEGSKRKISFEEFNLLWSGLVVAVEKNDVEKHMSSFMQALPVLTLWLVSVCFILSIAFVAEWTRLISVLLSGFGCWISYHLMKEELGVYNPISSKICNSVFEQTSCSEIVNSKLSKITGSFSLSDLAIIYFTFQLIILAILGYNKTFFFSLSLVSLPVLVYSIGVQSILIKKWCPLCVGVGFVVLGLFAASYQSLRSLSVDLVFFFKGLVIFFLVAIFWMYLKELLLKSIELPQIKIEYLRFKKNKELFAALLAKETIPETVNLKEESKITFGNPQSSLVINAVTNPFCGHCSKAFSSYDKLLKSHGSHFRLNIIFSVDSVALEKSDFQIAARLIEMYSTSTEDAYDALKVWYLNKDAEQWHSDYGKTASPRALEILKDHAEWSRLNEIQYVPATIIGNCFFPAGYEISDLSFFISDLIENSKCKTSDREYEHVVP